MTTLVQALLVEIVSHSIVNSRKNNRISINRPVCSFELSGFRRNVRALGNQVHNHPRKWVNSTVRVPGFSGVAADP